MTAQRPDGRKVRSLNNGDSVSRALFGLDRDGVNKVLRANGMGAWVKTSAKLNHGQHRMVAGNKLRSLVRGGTVAQVGPFFLKTLEQRSPTAEDAFAANVGTPKRKRKAK